MLKINKEEFDRLMETSPNIPEGIIQSFKNNFNNAASFELIVKPEICDILIPTNEYRNPWNNDENRLKNLNNSPAGYYLIHRLYRSQQRVQVPLIRQALKI